MQATSPRWAPALAASHTMLTRIEVWDPLVLAGTLDMHLLDGAVTDQWVTGARRSLTLTLTPAAAPLIHTGIELRVWRGIAYGDGTSEMLPLGCFPLTATSISIRADSTIQITAQDRWQWVVASQFSAPRAAKTDRTIKSEIESLITDTNQWPLQQITDTATSTAKPAAVVWDQDRHQAIVDLCKLIGGTAYVGRNGYPIIQDQPGIATPATYLRTGINLADAVEEISAADVHNVVVVTSSTTDTKLDPVILEITDKTHPAYPRPGVPRSPSRLDGPYTSAAQMKTAGQKELTRVSGPARQLKLTVISPDASLDAGDTILAGILDRPDELAQIKSVTHPLVDGADQDITTVSTRSEDQ